MARARRLAALLVFLFLFVGAVPAAQAADVGLAAGSAYLPDSQTQPPPGFRTNAVQARRIAERQPEMSKAQRKHPKARLEIQLEDGVGWNAVLFDGKRAIVLMSIAGDGRVLKTWTGMAAASPVAQGHFDRHFHQWWILAPFCLLFLAPFVDLRRWRRMLHLDLLVVVSFVASYVTFFYGKPETAVPLFYLPLLYVLGRTLWIGLRRDRPAPRGRLVPHLPTAALLVGVVALFGARVALNVYEDRVVDVGYASVVGADRLAHKQQLYEDNEVHGDTYGPVNYLAYIPFEIAFPWKGEWDGVPAAHVATLLFDLLTLLGLFLLGRRLRAGPEGRRLGLALAWAWAACPWTLFGVMENSNDGLIALLFVGALLAFSSAGTRGALLGLAAAAKFAPGALMLLFARPHDGEGRRTWLRCSAACLAVFAFPFVLYMPDGGLREIWACTLGFQLDRMPDFSLWAMTDTLGWLQKGVSLGALALAGGLAFLPGRRTLVQTAALSTAVLVAFQLPGGHWFYFYVIWFMPLTLVALFAPYRDAAVAAAADDGSGTDREVVELGGVGLGRLAA